MELRGCGLADAGGMICLRENSNWRRGISYRMHASRQFTLLYGTIAGVLAAIGAVVLVVGTSFAIPRKGPQSSAILSSFHITPTVFVILVIVSGLITTATLLAVGFYWRAKNMEMNIAQENARRQREEVEKTLKRLRERMSLPSLVELNRLMLTEYHSIATHQAQKSFRSSQRAMLGGFSWLIACFTTAILTNSLNGKIIAATMAPAGGMLAAFLGRTYLFVYERALAQLSQYYNQPLLNSYYLAAERLTSEISLDAKDRLLENVVEQLLVVARKLSEGSAQANATRGRNRIRVPGMRQVPADEGDSKDHSAMAAPAG